MQSFGLDEKVRASEGIARIELMTIQIPDDLVHSLEQIAAAQKKSVEQVAVERLRSLLDAPTSPEVVLRTIRALPHPSRAAVDDLEAAIDASQLPVREEEIFDRRHTE